MFFIVDRFENDFAVCETEEMKMINIPLSELPNGCIEGTKLLYDHNKNTIVDNSSDRERIKNKLNKLFGK